MTRSPLAGMAILAAGLAMAACGASPAGHAGAPKGSPSSSATATPTSAVAAAEAGFRAWDDASGILTGPRPASAGPGAEADIEVLGRAFALPGWRTAIAKGLVLVQTPPGCMVSQDHIVGAFAAPQPLLAAEVAQRGGPGGPAVGRCLHHLRWRSGVRAGTRQWPRV
jgi:hypothetical protein